MPGCPVAEADARSSPLALLLRRGTPRRFGLLLFRYRYVLLVAWGVFWFLPEFNVTSRILSDWLPFEVGARTLAHWHHAKVWATPALYLYDNNPQLQIGPPPLLLVAAFERFSPHTVALGFGLAMVAAGVAAVGALEAFARNLPVPPRRGGLCFASFALVEVVTVAVWSHEVGWWRHLDDVMALLGICLALWLCARRSSWWVVGLIMGTAVAAKPWALVALPLLAGLARSERARAVLLTIVVAGAWWAPFVLAAPGTVHALGDYHIFPQPGSVVALFITHRDVAGWLRPVQLTLGLGCASYVAARGRWLAAPLAGIAVRVLLDPYAYGYYGLGPVLAGFAVDLSGTRRHLPLWSSLALGVEFGVPWLAPPNVAAAARLAWSLGVLVVLLRRCQQLDFVAPGPPGRVEVNAQVLARTHR